jgi:hypothetical protein
MVAWLSSRPIPCGSGFRYATYERVLSFYGLENQIYCTPASFRMAVLLRHSLLPCGRAATSRSPHRGRACPNHNRPSYQTRSRA